METGEKQKITKKEGENHVTGLVNQQELISVLQIKTPHWKAESS